MDVVSSRSEQGLLPTEFLDCASVATLPETVAFHQQVDSPIGEPISRSLRTVVNSLSPKLSILMPLYNEEATVAQAIREVLDVDYPCDIELIAVDDGSTDRTFDLLSQVKDDRMIVHRHQVNQGKGAALLSAASLATGSYILPFDADLEYSAEDIPRLLRPVLANRCSVVYGTRLFGYNTVYQSYRYVRRNRWLTRLANLLFDACINDLHACLKLIPMEIFDQLALSEPGFGFDTEMTALILKQGVRPFEVPVSYYGHPHSQGKKISRRDVVVSVRILLRVRTWTKSTGSANRQRQFSPVYDAAVICPDESVLSKAC